MKWWIFCFLGLIISGSAFAFELGPDGESAKTLLENIASGDTTKVVDQLDKNLGSEADRLRGIGQIKDHLKNITASRQYFSDNKTVSNGTLGKFYSGELRIEEGDGQSYLLRYHCKEIDGKFIFDTFRLFPITDEQKANAQFHLSGRSIGDYAFMLAAIFIALFSLYSAVMVWNSGLRRKGLWTVACLVSVVQFSITWTPGEFLGVPIPSVNFLKFIFLGAGFARMGTYNPYVLAIGIPVGAILFWRAKHKAESKVEMETKQSS